MQGGRMEGVLPEDAPKLQEEGLVAHLFFRCSEGGELDPAGDDAQSQARGHDLTSPRHNRSAMTDSTAATSATPESQRTYSQGDSGA